ncbi:helix-turn-helix domain-containing protein [Deinococcus phoenicis]|nr:helix-turn-helix transcriptional regulator [Deinococcus phoenicis]
MPHVRWKLPEIAKEHGLGGYRLTKAMLQETERGRMNTIYRLLSDKPPTRVDLETLSALITALRTLTGREYKVGDLLEYLDAEEEQQMKETGAGVGGDYEERSEGDRSTQPGPEND